MKKAGPLAAALAALFVAIATWLGFDLDGLTTPPSAPPATTASTAPPAATPAKPAKPNARPVPAGDFDYYVLSLSWSPSYCETEATERDRLQCGARPFGFIVHGLWPQNERGYPEDCPTDNPRVPDALIDEMLDIMPSRGLIGHEWRSHGACTGLSQEDYFAAVRTAWERVTIPPRFQQPEAKTVLSPRDVIGEFLRANPELRPDAMAVTCDGNRLDEVRICMSRDFAFQPCGPQAARSQCRRDRVDIPAPEGSR
ncbi:hypothetical protein sos41_43320 [Alphaproteobacteria bacterium SO-S41]|nr:hypothetical protein sos41_43320 [Alphaproteobacteria bacterium SO-S41]